MPDSPPATAPPPLPDPLEATGASLRSALRDLVRSLPGPPERPTALSRGLGIDKSLAWKVMRTIDADDALQALHYSAAPNGLRKFLDAARSVGANAQALKQADRAVEALAVLLRDYPGGRSELDSAISVRVPEAKEAADHEARRKIAQGTAHIQGRVVDTRYRAMCIRPSAGDHDRCDAIQLFLWQGFRRIRPGKPMLLNRIARPDHAEDQRLQSLTLEGEAPVVTGDELNPLLLPEFCDDPIPPIESRTTETALEMHLGDTTPGRSHTFAMAEIIPRAYARRRGPDNPYDYFESRTHMAERVVVQDMLLRDDAFDLVRPPFVTQHDRQSPIELVRPDRPGHARDLLQQAFGFETMGRGVARWRSDDVPNAQAMLARVLERAGEDPDRYDLWRFRQAYPIPNSVRIWWFELAR